MIGVDAKRIVKRGMASVFLRNVTVLMTGTVAGRVIAFAIAPVITRLYVPAYFGVFGVFFGVAALFAAISTLRYDQALMLPRRNEKAVNLFGLSVISTVVVAVTSALICLPFADQIGRLTGSPEIVRWMWLIPVSVLAAGAFQTLDSWAMRRKQFRKSATAKVMGPAVASGSQIAAGFQGAGPLGLIGGLIAGNVFASFPLAVQVVGQDRQLVCRSLRVARMRLLARRYSDFPMFSAPVALLNALSQNVPLLVLAHYFGPAAVGFYVLAFRVLQLPATIVLTSLRQVFFQKASEVYRSGGDTYLLFRRVTLGLFAISAVPTSLIVLFAPWLFSFVFGASWEMAGEYARWLTIWTGVAVAEIPAVLFSRIYRKQETLLLQQVASFLCRLGALVIGGLYLTALQTVMLYSLISAGFSTMIVVWMWWFLKTQVVKEEIV